MIMNKCYSEMKRFKSFEERFEYLKLQGKVGADIFGSRRYLNQHFYTSQFWKNTRDQVIIRDGGFDLGVEGVEIFGRIIIHHINPITIEQLENGDPSLYDLENLISTSNRTHQDLHYGNNSKILNKYIERKPNDTIPWRNQNGSR